VRLHTYEWGSGAPIVCLHGVTAHGLRFRKLAEERLAARFRTVAVDLRGHGQSSWDPPWDLAAHLDDLEETAAALGIERATWIGHSFGGRLATELAARRPELVERLVLLDPAYWVPPHIGLQRAENERSDRSYSSVDEAIARRVVESTLHHTPRELLEEEMRDHLVAVEDGRFRMRYCQSAVVAAYGELVKPPQPFERVQLPTLLVRGELTDVVPQAVVQLYRDGLGDQVEVETVPGGHNVLWDAFEETADAVERFLA
jgi:lipase